MSISSAKHVTRALSSTISIARMLSTAAAPGEAAAAAGAAESKRKETTALYRRLSGLRSDPSGSVEATMESWMKGGKSVTSSTVMGFVRELRKYRDFKHALQLLDWMEKNGMSISTTNHAVRLDLISKVKGIEEAEDYFFNLPKSAKNQKTFSALLSGYCQEKMADKALALYEEMKELNFATSTLVNTNLMTLYMKLGQPEKVISHFQEMKEDGFFLDRVAYGLLINSYASLNDIDSVERVVQEMKEGGKVSPDWTIYCSLATIYNSLALFDKSNSVLRKAEEIMNRHNRAPYEYIISLYASAGNLSEVKRMWKLLKDGFTKTNNTSYLCMLHALKRLGDVDGLKDCFQEWESTYVSFDVRLVNVVIDAYLKNDMVEDAELSWKKAVKALENGNGNDLKMLEMFVDYYLKRHEMDFALKYFNIMKSKGLKPGEEKLNEFLKYIGEVKDVDGAEEFSKVLGEFNCS